MKYLTLESQVKFILKTEPATRNSDVTLMIRLWQMFHPDKVTNGNMIKLSSLYDLPREDNIKRVRAKIQNDEHLYVPTEWEVAKQRKFLQEEWRRYLKYRTEADKSETETKIMDNTARKMAQGTLLDQNVGRLR